MRLQIIVDVEDCPYKGKKEHSDPDRSHFHKCKHPDGFGKCVAKYNTFEKLCPVAVNGGLIK